MKLDRSIIASALIVAGLLGAQAGDYYVNADLGDDKYDGSSPTVLSETAGPKATLIGALTNAVDGDTVYAAAGVYSNGVYVTGSGLRFRAHVKAGVTLVGEGPDTTFIVGAKDPEGDKDGCGPNAVACVYLAKGSNSAKGAIIKGFSVSGGRSCKAESAKSSDAAGIAAGNSDSLAVDCVISNNVNVYRGGGVSFATCARCVFAGGNKAGDVTWSGTAINSSYFINCIFHPDETGVYKPASNECYFHNCTGVSSRFRVNDTYRLTCYNCIVDSSHRHHKYVNCILKGAPNSDADVDELTKINAGETLKLAHDFSPEFGSVAIDGCVGTYYEDAFKTWWKISAIEKELDNLGRARKMGASIDIGAVECDIYAATLSPRNISTVEFTDGIKAEGRKVIVPAGDGIKYKWTPPPGMAADEIEYNFTANVTEGATLKVTRAGVGLFSITQEDGEKQYIFKAVGDQELLFSVSGENGVAELSRFRNSTKVSITDDLGGVDIEGMEIGETEIVNDESITLTISRNYATQKLCTGLIINGEFFSFTGESADNIYTKEIAARDDDLTIKAVYAEYNTWYVNASAVDDSADGRTPYRPKKTLQAAMEIEDIAPGDVVHAAAGRYDAGKYEEKNSSGAVTSRYRVRVAHGVLLEGEGADKTFIVGEIDKTGTKGCGPNAMRCVYMPYDSSITAQNATSAIKGFAVCEGRTLAADGYSHIGGGVCCNDYGYVIDCVISNNAAYRGGGVMSGNYVRCRFVDNSCASTAATDAYNAKNFWDCYCEGGVYSPNRAITCRNSTFKTRVWSGGEFNITLDNCIMMHTSSETNSICSNTLMLGKVTSCKSADEKTKKVTEEELALNENGVPGRNSIAVDYGDNAFHDKVHNISHWVVKRMENRIDCAGFQRVYNGAIDVGAHEYDWRGDFAGKLSGEKRFSVAEATPGVTNAVDGVVLSAGAESVTLVWRGKCAGRASLLISVDGEGELEVKVGGVKVEAEADGNYSFDLPVGESKIEVAYAGAGSATVKSFAAPLKGTIMVVR